VTLYLLNGPPRSGKDTAARLLGQLLGEGTTGHWKLSGPLKVRTHAMYGLFGLDRRPFAAGYFESFKDKPRHEFRGITPREAYIQAHERYWKPVHGPEILGHLLVAENVGRVPQHVVVSDAGDDAQCLPLVALFGAENTVIIHLSRPGTTWDNRRSFTIPGVRTVAIENATDDLTTFRLALVRALA
jgi:hypothetical protein